MANLNTLIDKFLASSKKFNDSHFLTTNMEGGYSLDKGQKGLKGYFEENKVQELFDKNAHIETPLNAE